MAVLKQLVALDAAWSHVDSVAVQLTSMLNTPPFNDPFIVTVQFSGTLSWMVDFTLAVFSVKFTIALLSVTACLKIGSDLRSIDAWLISAELARNANKMILFIRFVLMNDLIRVPWVLCRSYKNLRALDGIKVERQIRLQL